MAEGDGDETGDNGNDGTEDDRDEHPEEARRGDNRDGAEGAAEENGASEVGPGDFYGTRNSAVFDNKFFDVREEGAEVGADNVADVNESGADDEGEVNQNGADDDFREDSFDAVIAEADASDLGIDDDQDKDNKDDVSDAADVFPDETDGGFFIEGDGFDNEEVFDDVVNTVDGVRDDAGGRTDEPADGAGLVPTGVFSGAGLGFGFVLGLSLLLGFGGGKIFVRAFVSESINRGGDKRKAQK